MRDVLHANLLLHSEETNSVRHLSADIFQVITEVCQKSTLVSYLGETVQKPAEGEDDWLADFLILAPFSTCYL